MTIKKAKQNNIEYVIKIINQNKKYQYINKKNELIIFYFQ